MNEAAKLADQVIEAIKSKNGTDYTPVRDELTAMFDDDLLNGNWSTRSDFGVPGLPELRIIEENEYDQSMDEDEKPDWDSMVVDISGYYVFPV